MSEIIDGIDVSGCKDYRLYSVPNEDGDEFNDICDNASEESSFCYKNPNCYYKQLKRLQAENERLKETCDGLLKIQYALADSANKYEKALEEIREIAVVRFVSGINEEADAYNQDMIRIYNKIDEVLK